VNFSMLKRYSGYKPFLYNITVDACKILKHPKSNPHDLVVDKLPTSFINQQLTGALSFPHGDYLFHSEWLAHGVHRATVDFFYTLS
ncbi:hypothetical protein KR054_002263, partial [Drosophila jambulina]